MAVESIILAVVSALAGGGLTRLFTVRESKTGAKIDNSKRIIAMYEDIAKRYEDLACYRMACSKRLNRYHEDEDTEK